MEASLASIYYHVGAIVVLSSEIGWNGVMGNTVKPVVEKWKKENDFYDKIKIIDFDSLSQDAQYQFGMMIIRKMYPQCQWVMIVDSDEVWDDENLLIAKNKYLKFGRKWVKSYKSKNVGYIKSLLYMIDDNNRAVRATVFVRPDVAFKGVRGSGIEPAIVMEDIFFHHVSYVRKTDELVFEKIRTSTIGDLGTKSVDLDLWKKNVWDKIPNVSNFHYTVGFEYVWKSIVKLDVEDLPKVLQTHPMLSRPL